MPRQATTSEIADEAGRARPYLVAALAEPQKIAPMPQVCAQLAELTTGESSDASKLARLIQTDAALAGEVIRVANSPGMRPRCAVVSLQQAVSWLGIAEVRNIAMAIMLRGEVFSVPGHEAQAQTFWQEAWLAALWAKEISRLRRKHAETSFLAALMFRTGAALALKVLARFEAEQRAALDAALITRLSVEFEARFAIGLMKSWRIAAEVQAAVAGWRDYLSSKQTDMSATVHAAQLLAAHTMHPQLISEDVVMSDVVFEALGIFPQDRRSLLDRVESIRALGAI